MGAVALRGFLALYGSALQINHRTWMTMRGVADQESQGPLGRADRLPIFTAARFLSFLAGLE